MGGKRRWLEWAKNLAIAGLSLSAVWLLTMTPLVRDSGLLGQLTPQTHSGQEDSVTLAAAVYPVRIAMNGSGGRYGVQYDQEEVDRLFAQVGPLLGEALITAGQPQAMYEGQWRSCLQGEGIYFDFGGQVPLAALGSWLQNGGQCQLSGAARRIVLAAGAGDQVLLCFQQGEDYYFCQTGLSSQLHLDAALERVEGNGACFAFEQDTASQLLDPYTFITDDVSGQVYDVSTPITAGGDLEPLLETLSFSGQNHTSISGGEAFLEGESRLEVRSSGTVLYRGPQQSKYPVAYAGAQPTLTEMVGTARELADGTVGRWCGQARVSLLSAQQTQEGWLIRFGYQLNGSAVWLYEEGWAAEFLVQEGYITRFTLHIRSYTATGEQALLLSQARAAALLPSLTIHRRELVVQYRDQGEGQIAPIWVAQ